MRLRDFGAASARLDDFPQDSENGASSGGLLNGALTGFTGSQVMPLMPYMLALNLEPALFVQAVNIAVVVASAFLGIGHG